MNNSTTHTKDRTITRTLSLLLAGLMMFGLFGTLPLYGCSGGDTTPVATPGKDALQNATPGSDDAGQPTAEITAEPTHTGMHGRAIANTVESGTDSDTETGIFIL